MTDEITRREFLQAAAVAAASLPAIPAASDRALASASSSATVTHAPGDIVDLTSTSEIFTPPRGRSYMKFSFDFPEPSVSFGDYRFGFLIFTNENTYGLDRSKMRVEGTGDA